MIGWHSKIWVWFRSGFLLSHQWHRIRICWFWLRLIWIRLNGVLGMANWGLVWMSRIRTTIEKRSSVRSNKFSHNVWENPRWKPCAPFPFYSGILHLRVICDSGWNVNDPVSQPYRFYTLTCTLSLDIASRRDWLASDTSSVSSNSATFASASLLPLSFSTSGSINACSFFVSLLLAWAAGGQVLASDERDARYFCSVPESSPRCFAGRSSRCRLLDVSEIREVNVLEVREADLAFGAVLTEDSDFFSYFRKAINIITSFFENFVVLHSHVAQPAFQITLHGFRVCSFICERLKLFLFTKWFGLCIFTQFNLTFNSYLPLCVTYSFRELLLAYFQLCFRFSTTFIKFSHLLLTVNQPFSNVLGMSKGMQRNLCVLFLFC